MTRKANTRLQQVYQCTWNSSEKVKQGQRNRMWILYKPSCVDRLGRQHIQRSEQLGRPSQQWNTTVLSLESKPESGRAAESSCDAQEVTVSEESQSYRWWWLSAEKVNKLTLEYILKIRQAWFPLRTISIWTGCLSILVAVREISGWRMLHIAL